MTERDDITVYKPTGRMIRAADPRDGYYEETYDVREKADDVLRLDVVKGRETTRSMVWNVLPV